MQLLIYVLALAPDQRRATCILTIFPQTRVKIVWAAGLSRGVINQKGPSTRPCEGCVPFIRVQ